RVWLDDRELGHEKLSGQKAEKTLSVPMHELARNGARVTLAREGKGKLYYTLRLSYVRGELPRSGVERGFAVEREYECIGAAELARGDTKGKACGSVKAGDYVRVVVRVAVPATRRFVLVEGPLPAGLEAVNFSLPTT